VLINKDFGGSKNKDKKQRLKLTQTVSSVSLLSTCNMAVSAPIADYSHYVFYLFFGGDNNCLAVCLLLQLAKNPQVTATIVYYNVPDSMLNPILGSTLVIGTNKLGNATIIIISWSCE